MALVLDKYSCWIEGGWNLKEVVTNIDGACVCVCARVSQGIVSVMV